MCGVAISIPDPSRGSRCLRRNTATGNGWVHTGEIEHFRDPASSNLRVASHGELWVLPCAYVQPGDRVPRLSSDTRSGFVRTHSLLRRLGLRGLDSHLFDRAKEGFVLPIGTWQWGDLGSRQSCRTHDTERA